VVENNIKKSNVKNYLQMYTYDLEMTSLPECVIVGDNAADLDKKKPYSDTKDGK